MSFYFRIKKAERQRGAQKKKGSTSPCPEKRKRAAAMALVTEQLGTLEVQTMGRRTWYQRKAEDRTWDSKARFTVWLRTQLCPH